MKKSDRFKKYVPSLLLLLLFEAVAVTLWLTKGNLFYLLNFSYIGCCLVVGTECILCCECTKVCPAKALH